MLKLTQDPDWAVRRQLAATLGSFPQGSPARRQSSRCWSGSATIRLTVDAALSGLADREPAILQRVLAAPEQTPQRAAVITTLAATIVKGGQDKPVQDLLQAVAENSRPAWQRRPCSPARKLCSSACRFLVRRRPRNRQRRGGEQCTWWTWRARRGARVPGRTQRGTPRTRPAGAALTAAAQAQAEAVAVAAAVDGAARLAHVVARAERVCRAGSVRRRTRTARRRVCWRA